MKVSEHPTSRSRDARVTLPALAFGGSWSELARPRSWSPLPRCSTRCISPAGEMCCDTLRFFWISSGTLTYSRTARPRLVRN